MKYVIASDIHGSAFWCSKLLKAFEQEQADKLLLLGDLLYHGPRNPLPQQYDCPEVYDALNAIKDKILCVRGNCDSDVDQMVLEFPITAPFAILEVKGRTVFATHGHLYDDTNPPMLQAGDVLLNGHFHVPTIKTLSNGIIYANCGSVGLPKGGSVNSYIVLEEDIKIKSLSTGEVIRSFSL